MIELPSVKLLVTRRDQVDRDRPLQIGVGRAEVLDLDHRRDRVARRQLRRQRQRKPSQFGQRLARDAHRDRLADVVTGVRFEHAVR